MKRKIRVTDRQIDRLVYELYGLAEVEIKRFWRRSANPGYISP